MRMAEGCHELRLAMESRHMIRFVRRLGIARRWLGQQPLGFRLYFWFWTLTVPTGLALLFSGLVVPGLVVLVIFVIDQAVFTPLIVARSQKQSRS
jgi:hypothetical protein